ncbi:hypothetical protein NE237_012971 [Protea cynaroides]|uniref:DUF7074 domain-containing protein n=1 Tax=Protea cynaroides TaxID=273540 RepID=A0A9Q0GYG7_9MAGN|nr:hypothetical protein NE237_012971 [Protea cynaroides]
MQGESKWQSTFDQTSSEVSCREGQKNRERSKEGGKTYRQTRKVLQKRETEKQRGREDIPPNQESTAEERETEKPRSRGGNLTLLQSLQPSFKTKPSRPLLAATLSRNPAVENFSAAASFAKPNQCNVEVVEVGIKSASALTNQWVYTEPAWCQWDLAVMTNCFNLNLVQLHVLKLAISSQRVFVFGILLFTLVAATYQPKDPLFRPSTKITNFLESTTNATFRSDDTIVQTGENFMASNQTAFDTFINITDITIAIGIPSDSKGDIHKPIDCTDKNIFNLLMKASIKHFNDIHFYRFGKPVRGSNESSCDMAWRFRPPNHGKTAAFYKDYSRYVICRSGDCNWRLPFWCECKKKEEESDREPHCFPNRRSRRNLIWSHNGT